jgi:uncharacterized membrane protein (DUF373 family)
MTKDSFISKTESWVYLTLSVLAILFIIVETIDLIYIFYKELSRFSFEEGRPLGLSGVPIFFNILITLEILETFKNNHNTILSKVKIILLIAITAVVRKVITIDIKHSEYMMLISIAVLLLSFCIGYYFLSKNGDAKKSFYKKTNP